MTTDTNTFTLQSQGEDIVLNRMYTGSYLSSNLGHEVINMFQADNDKHYLYLNSKGNFSKDGASVSTMLLVRGIGEKRVEIIGLAKNLKFVKSAQCKLPRDLGRVNKKIQTQQWDYMKSIEYGGALIKDIFGDEGQQSVFISYETDANNFYLPQRRIIINFKDKQEDDNSKKKAKNSENIYLTELSFASTSLHQYVSENSNKHDWTVLHEICENASLWKKGIKKVEVPDNLSEQQDSLFDICRIQDDENRFSNALSYFIEKYPDIWIKFFESKGVKLSKIDSVTREEDAKIDNSKCEEKTGGRIDLLIRTPECYIIIENKIDSRIIFQGGVSQIQRYYNYVNYLQREEKERLEKAKKELESKIDGYKAELGECNGMRSTPNRNKKINKLKTEKEEAENELKYLPEFKEREVIGFVLAPNYNPPTDSELEVKNGAGQIVYKYEPVSYKEIYDWLQDKAEVTIDKDPNFKAFHNAMKKHTYATKSEAIREDMMNIFFTRIQKCHTKKYFTKSAFAMSLECPRRLYYAYDKDVYVNQDVDDEFLQSLAEGGFQVGEFAKLCYGIAADNMVGTLDADDAIAKTIELLRQENVNIAEAAFRVGNMFVRADIIEKKGNVINLIEVKAKSWNPREDSFEAKNGKSTNKAIRPYLYDVAFQKYVIVQALKEIFPDRSFSVNAFLMLADKSRIATVNSLNQLFKIKSEPNKRSKIIVATNAHEVVEAIPLSERIVRPFDVDHICDKIIAGDYAEQQDAEFMMGLGFERFVNKMSDDYCNHRKTDCIIGSKCFSCPFHKKADDKSSDIFDGYCEFWVEKAGFDPSATDKPLIKDMSGQYIGTKRDDFVKTFKYFMENLTDADLARHSGKTHRGLDHYERKWLQIGVATKNEDILKEYRHNMIGDTYLDVPGLKEEMKGWKFPLHFIDFETSAVALPFYDKMRPYEQIAFQFSHHRVDMNEDGTYKVTHAGQFINTEKGHFPNFDFIRALKAELDQDEGTIFRYSNHENTILREIHRQLDARNEPDKKELQDFIDSITHYEEGKVKYVGDRDMVDLADVVLKYYFHPIMKGSYSIKVVLPAVQNSSDFIKEKYSKPVYGTPDMPSANLSEPKVWIEYGPDGSVLSPYKLLPPVSSYLGIETDLDEQELNVTESIANGGAALAAYAKMQFSDDTMSEALKNALLTYCELDTLAMVFIWEYFYHEC